MFLRVFEWEAQQALSKKDIVLKISAFEVSLANQ